MWQVSDRIYHLSITSGVQAIIWIQNIIKKEKKSTTNHKILYLLISLIGLWVYFVLMHWQVFTLVLSIKKLKTNARQNTLILKIHFLKTILSILQYKCCFWCSVTGKQDKIVQVMLTVSAVQVNIWCTCLANSLTAFPLQSSTYRAWSFISDEMYASADAHRYDTALDQPPFIIHVGCCVQYLYQAYSFSILGNALSQDAVQEIRQILDEHGKRKRPVCHLQE